MAVASLQFKRVKLRGTFDSGAPWLEPANKRCLLLCPQDLREGKGGANSAVVSPMFDMELDAMKSVRASYPYGLNGEATLTDSCFKHVGSRMELELNLDQEFAELHRNLSCFERQVRGQLLAVAPFSIKVASPRSATSLTEQN